ncbi:hypothetical protein LWI28_000343 [Acer negundo]|uniref:Uncharacterized protein n=1 Tax=Acer negundo TaxID=4023 RepID=A0AAD5JHI7_ACENE|nr:hypothetical protein LWI28_000343 [Acer negundo]
MCEGVKIHNPNTDSILEFGGLDTAEERKRCARGARLANGQPCMAKCGTQAGPLSAHVCHTCPTWAADVACYVMIKEVCSYVASFVEPIDLDEKKINDLILENEHLSNVNKSLNKKLDNHGLGSKDFNELKDKILSLEMNLNNSNDRLSILKLEIEQRDNSLVSARRLENMLKAKLSKHLNQEKSMSND